MNERTVMPWLLLAATCGASAGCIGRDARGPTALGDVDAASRLERLERFVGQWSVEGEMTRRGSSTPMRFSGTNDVRWEGDGSYLVGRGVTRAAGRGESHGIGVWTYDAANGAYRSVSASGTGSVAMGEARYDAVDRCWHMKIRGTGPEGRTAWIGRITFVDEDTKKERWTGYTLAGLWKTAEITKTERRVK